MADVSGKFFSAKKVRTGVSPSSPGVEQGETLPPVNPPGTSLNSVGLTMPSAFAVANSPLTSNGTIAVTGAGTTDQYIRGDGSLQNFPSLTGYVPYTGATADVDLGTHDLTAERGTFANNGSSDTLTVNHTSGSGIGVKVTKGGNNEALLVTKTSGSGNAMAVVGGRTALVDLSLSSVSNATGNFLTISGGVVHQRTPSETRSDVGAQAQLNGTGFVKASGTTITYDNSTYQVTSEKAQPNGYASLDGNGKVPLAQINDALIGNVNYQGLWNAATNNPTLVNPPSSGTKGYYYIVSTAGTFASISFEVGDWIISDGTAWGKVDNTDAVSSVFGRTGNVTATNGDYNTSQVTENTNLYFTNARAIASVLTGYTSGPGTISAADSILSAIQKLNGNIGGLTTGVSSVFGRTGAVVAVNGDYYLGTTAIQAASANQGLTGITGITFVAHVNDSASITTTISSTSTFFDFNLSDDNLNDEWRWRFTPSGASVYDAMRLVPTTNTTSDLIVSGAISGSNLSGTNTGNVTLGTANGLSLSTQQLSLGLASAGVTGALSGTDWSTFNSKQQALNGTGFVKISGTTISYDNTNYLPLTGGTLTGALNGTTANFSGNSNSAFVPAYLLNSSTGTLARNILQFGNNLGNNGLIELFGGNYTGTVGGDDVADTFRILSSGTGGIAFRSNAGSLRFYTGSTERLQINLLGASTFTSSVTATSFIISGGTSSQFLKADGSVDSNSYYLASNPSAFIALTALSGTAPIQYNNTTGAISITQASGSTNGFLSSTDWTAFNSKQQALNGTGFVKISGTTISYDNSTYLTGNQTITLSGDATGSGATAITVVLANSGVTAGTYNDSATQVRPFTVDAKGRITSIGTAVTITPDWANISGQRTLTRDDAGLQGDAGARSGFFETFSPVNYYSGANSWQHLIESRHTNDSNNYAMQIAGSFFDQEFYVRKTNNSATTAWSRLWHSGNITPVTGTGDSNYLPKFTGASTIGDSNFQENSGSLGINGAATPDGGDTRVQINATTYSSLSLKSTSVNAIIRAHNPNAILYVGTISNHPVSFVTNDSEKMVLSTSGNLGLGVTPSAYTVGKVIEVGTLGNSFWGLGINSVQLSSNYYFDGAYRYANNGFANRYDIGSSGGQHIWFNAPNNTSGAGAAISFTQAMTLGSNSGLSIGTPSAAPAQGLLVQGASTFSDISTFNNGTNSTNGIKVISSLSSSLFTGGIEFLRTTVAGGSKVQPLRDAAIGGVGFDFLVTANNTAEINATYTSALQILNTGAATFASSVTATAGIFNLNTTDGGFKIVGVNATPPNLAYLANNYFPKFYTRNHNFGITIFDQDSNNVGIQAADLVNGTSAKALIFNPYGGNVLIGTTTDSGFKLDVNGTGRFSWDLVASNNIYSGGSTSLVTSDGVLGQSEVIQIFNGGAASTNIDKIADLILANNSSFTNGTIGRVIGVNNNLISSDKRIAQISMFLDGATNSGAIEFTTMNAGTFGTRLTIASTGAATFSSTLDATNLIKVTNNNTAFFSSANFQLAAHNGASVVVGAAIFQTSSASIYGEILGNQTNIYGSAANGIRMATATAPIIFATGNADADFSTARLTITSGGNVGVGTNSPSYLFTVGQAGTTQDSVIQIASTTTGTGSLYFGDTTGTFFSSYMGGFQYSHFNDLMVFITNATEQMRILSSGNVLIGTTTDVSGAKLNVNGAIRTGTLDTGYVPGNWKLGRAVIGTQPSETHQIIVEINGALFVIGAAQL